MPLQNHYKVLGVPRDASVVEINRTYRKLVLMYHPHNGGDAEVFKKISAAHEVLIDIKKRTKFDAELALYRTSEIQVDMEMVGLCQEFGLSRSLNTSAGAFRTTSSFGKNIVFIGPVTAYKGPVIFYRITQKNKSEFFVTEYTFYRRGVSLFYKGEKVKSSPEALLHAFRK